MIFILISILLLVGVIFTVLFWSISKHRQESVSRLIVEKQAVQDRYNALVHQKKGLTQKVDKLERKAKALRTDTPFIETVEIAHLDMDDDDTERHSRYLISQGKISLEQNEIALKKMALMKMDYLGVCLSLGFIDLETSKKTTKANKSS